MTERASNEDRPMRRAGRILILSALACGLCIVIWPPSETLRLDVNTSSAFASPPRAAPRAAGTQRDGSRRAAWSWTTSVA
jgi:hypothetical protein